MWNVLTGERGREEAGGLAVSEWMGGKVIQDDGWIERGEKRLE